ncbi:hypothetical protein Geob_1033 [Geotalea daltonii FRC-32]|uniref:Uncharacterized protein n=1 Tax=Geotalea daltonii (strain DSM 22248 / JCM 15807 / FRC-32) TaxID=316067 RepID=B9M2L5_GEODF|nr:hypothetical protein Geob_1033 [Geotalea daltonii FRC-32]
MRMIGIKIILFILLWLAFASLTSVTPAYAVTPCQSIQQQVDLYLNNPPSIYCKYTPEFGESEVKIWRDCDYRPAAIKTVTYSPGTINYTQSGTVTCCYPDRNCYLPENQYKDTYTNTYYKTIVKNEYCDGHITTNEYSYGMNWIYNYASYTGYCATPGSSNLQTYVVPQHEDSAAYCASQVTRYLYTTISIPANCNDCYDSSDPCCGSTDKCCGKGPCCGDPCCGDVCCQNQGE